MRPGPGLYEVTVPAAPGQIRATTPGIAAEAAKTAPRSNGSGHILDGVLKQAVAHIREAIAVYLESLRSQGESIPAEDILIKPIEVRARVLGSPPPGQPRSPAWRNIWVSFSTASGEAMQCTFGPGIKRALSFLCILGGT
jgi:hypothetical protein